MNRGGISEPTDHASKGVYFMDELAFGGSADGRVAGLPGDAIEIEAEQCCVESEPGRGDGGFTSGMATPNDDHVEAFVRGSRQAHVFIIRSS